jgi:hypothetical protein
MKKHPKNYLIFLFLAIASVGAWASNFDEYLVASQHFFEKAEKSAPQNSMPRLSDKEAAQLLATLSDSQTFLENVEFKAKDLDSLMEVCDVASKLTNSYGLFNLKNRIDVKAEPSEVNMQVFKVIQANIYEFQPELALLQPFQIRCMSKQVEPMVKFVLGLKEKDLTEVRKAGLRQMRVGIASLYINMLQGTIDRSFSYSYRSKLLNALAATSETYQSVLSIQTRASILVFLNTMDDASKSDFRESLALISNAMSNAECKNLCAID